MSPTAPEFRTKPATLFTARAVITMCLWGLLLMVPVLAAILLVSVLRLGTLTFLVPLVTICAATFFLPFGFGNFYVARLARPLIPHAEPPERFFLVQLTCQPRHRAGFLALLEDADDIGFLSLTETQVVFDGDSIRLAVPYEHVRRLELQNSGWRALFAYGPRTSFCVAGLPEGSRFTFAERSSWHLPGSRRNARQLFESVSRKVHTDSLSPGS